MVRYSKPIIQLYQYQMQFSLSFSTYIYMYVHLTKKTAISSFFISVIRITGFDNRIIGDNRIQRFNPSDRTITYILTVISGARHIGIHKLGPVEEGHEKVIFALGIGTWHGDAFYGSGTFCRICAGCCREQQQNAVVHNPGIIHRLQTEKNNVTISHSRSTTVRILLASGNRDYKIKHFLIKSRLMSTRIHTVCMIDSIMDFLVFLKFSRLRSSTIEYRRV